MDDNKDDIKEIEVKEFLPTPIQAKFARLYLDTPSPRLTQEKIAEAIGINKRTIYNWLHKKEFSKWLSSRRLEILDSSLIDIYKILVTKAKMGDFNCIKLVMEMSGNYTPGVRVQNTGATEQIIIEVVQSQAQQPQQAEGDKQ